MVFNKLGKTTQLFNKIGKTDNFFRKLDNTSRKVDNSVARIGAFIHPVADMAHMGGFVDDAVNSVHAVHNGLEKALKTPIGEIRSKYA